MSNLTGPRHLFSLIVGHALADDTKQEAELHPDLESVVWLEGAAIPEKTPNHPS